MTQNARITCTLLCAMLGLAWDAGAAGIQPGTMVALQIPGQSPAGWLSASDVGGVLYISPNSNAAGWEQWQYGEPSGEPYLQSFHGLRVFCNYDNSAKQVPLFRGDLPAMLAVIPNVTVPAPFAAAVVVTMPSRTVPGGTVALAVNGPNLVWVPYVAGTTQLTTTPPKVAQQTPPLPELWWVLPQPSYQSGRASLRTASGPLVTTLTVAPTDGAVAISDENGLGISSTCASKCMVAFPSNATAQLSDTTPNRAPHWLLDNGASVAARVSLPMSINRGVTVSCPAMAKAPSFLQPNPYVTLTSLASNGVPVPSFIVPPLSPTVSGPLGLDASTMWDPATCRNSGLTFHWSISSTVINPGSSIADAGITGYRTPKLAIAQNALVSGTYTITLTATSEKTGLSTTIVNSLNIAASTLTSSVFAACQSQGTLGGQCTAAQALPSTETP